MFQRRAKRLFVKVGGSTFISALRESCKAPRIAISAKRLLRQSDVAGAHPLKPTGG